MGKDQERGWVEHKKEKKKKVKTKYLHYWEDMVDLVPRADVFSNQGLSQELSLPGTEIVGSFA